MDEVGVEVGEMVMEVGQQGKVEVEVEAVLVNAALPQTVQTGPPSVASGDIVRQRISLMGIQMLANVGHPQIAQTGPQLAPSGDIVRRMEVLLVEVKLVCFR